MSGFSNPTNNMYLEEITENIGIIITRPNGEIIYIMFGEPENLRIINNTNDIDSELRRTDTIENIGLINTDQNGNIVKMMFFSIYEPIGRYLGFDDSTGTLIDITFPFSYVDQEDLVVPEANQFKFIQR